MFYLIELEGGFGIEGFLIADGLAVDVAGWYAPRLLPFLSYPSRGGADGKVFG